MEDVPPLPPYSKSIDFSKNKIRIWNDSFQDFEHLEFLNFSYNKIELISMSNDRSLRNLRKLDLSFNRLLEDSFPNRLNILPLRDLRINNNLCKAYPEKFISAMQSLRILHIDVFKGFKFGSGFLSLMNLTEVQFYPRNSFQLRNDSFLGLSNSQIRSLQLQFYDFVYEVEAGVFSPFPHLRELTLNIGKRCTIRKALKTLYGLQGRQMELLNLSNNYLTSAIPIQLTEKDIYYLTTMCVRRVDLSRCTITKIPYTIADSRFANCLEEIRIGNNNFQASDVFPVVSMFSYANIKVFDCLYRTDRKPLAYSSNFDYNFQRNKKIFNITLTLSDALTSINVSGAPLYYIHGTYHNIHIVARGLEVIDFAFTQLFLCQRGLHITYDTSIRYLDLTFWQCSDLNPTFMKTLTSLQTLIFRSAELSEGFEKDPNGILLRGLSNLSTLDFGGNSLTALHDNLFVDQSLSLRTLSLQINVFSNIPKAIRNAQRLKLFDIKNNKISTLSETDTQILDDIKGIQIMMSRNPILCSCENLHMIRWLDKNRNKILDFDDLNCTDGKSLKDILFGVQFRQFELRCLGTFWLEFSASIFIVWILAIIITAMCYRYRVYIEYLYLLFAASKPQQEHDDGYEFDGFISYSTMDADWVMEVLYNRLTEEMKMKICIHDKDFIPGRLITSEILRCIDQSRKVIFVVTRNFLESEWGIYELEMARIHAFRRGRSGLLLILKDELLIDEMPDLLKRMWWKIVCMKWPVDDRSEERKLFWHNLKIAMET